MFRVLGVCVVMLFFAQGLAAQGRALSEADALLAKVGESLAARSHLEVTGFTRDLRVSEVQDAESATPTYRVSSAAYSRLVLTRRKPDDWRIIAQQEQVMRGEARPSRTLVFGKVGAGDSSVLVLNTTTKAAARLAIPEGMFEQEVNERIGHQRTQDALFRLLFRTAPGDHTHWAVFHGRAAELQIEGTEEVNGVQLTRIVSNWPSSSVTRLWVDVEAQTLVRVLETPGRQMIGMGISPEIKETLYRYDFTKGAADADFDLNAGWAMAQPNIASAAGFSPSTELFATLTSGGKIVPDAPVTRTPRTPKPPGAPQAVSPSKPAGTEAVATAPAPAPAVEEQSLTPQQMEAIVLVEGDGGVGSGFVARIRDVDFVVTNQHVIGGNEKIRVTTVRGVPIKVGAIFGAVGRDIAILRIEGENTVPALKIVDDPVQTVKFGDKVVVVGNRRGGGVATQVSGVVRGIGPDKIEVDAPFQPGNSGSPIVHVATGDVIGLATYSLTRRLDALDGPAGASATKTGEKPATEQRWFGHRAEGIAKWEAIDLAKWRVQAQRVSDFAEETEAIYYAMNGRFKEASGSVRVRQLTDRLDERVNRLGSSQAIRMQEVQEFFRSLRALSELGVKELKTGDYYDYFRTSLYWEASIPEQVRAREDLGRRLDKASENTSAFLARLRR